MVESNLVNETEKAKQLTPVEELKAYLAEVEAEEWYIPQMKRAVLAGIKMSIKRLEEKEREHSGNTRQG